MRVGWTQCACLGIRGTSSAGSSRLARKEKKIKGAKFSVILLFFSPVCFAEQRRWGESSAAAEIQAVTLSPSVIPFSIFSSSSSLRWKLASSVSLSSSHHRTDRRVGQVELARDVSGRVLLQEWTETERGGERGAGRWSLERATQEGVTSR